MSVLIDLRSAHAVCPDLSNEEHPSRAVQFLVEKRKKDNWNKEIGYVTTFYFVNFPVAVISLPYLDTL